jgi:hypothetical protein
MGNTNCVRAGKGICISNLEFNQQFFLLFILDNDAHWSHFAWAFLMFLLFKTAIYSQICTVNPKEVRWGRDVLSNLCSRKIQNYIYNYIYI